MATDEEYQTAKDDLERAIRAYYAITEPDTYIDAWIVVTHKLSPALEQEGTTCVGYMAATGQSFALTRGMLDVALSSDRRIS